MSKASNQNMEMDGTEELGKHLEDEKENIASHWHQEHS